MSELAHLFSSGWPEVVTFLLVLGRATGLMTSAPFWGSRMAPSLVRIIVTVSVSASIYPLVNIPSRPTAVPSELVLLLALAGELLIGLLLGWMAQFLFVGMRLAGQLIEIKVGIGLAQLIDPQEGGQSTFFSLLFDLLAVMVFLSVNGHHLLIRALVSSYGLFPLANENLVLSLVKGVVLSAGTLFTIALQVSAPIMMGLLLSDIVLAVMARAIPHLNVFLVAPPVQLAFAMLLFLLSLPTLVWFCVNHLSVLSSQFSGLSVVTSGGR